jgi:hypothetical protein
MWFVELMDGMLFVGLAKGMLFVELAKGMLFVKLMMAVGDWLWHSGRADNRLELGHDLFGEHVVERVRGRMENNYGGAEPIAWCD